ncbi:unnamed protein product, partial [Ectocarpus sp. 12 AP-2014]
PDLADHVVAFAGPHRPAAADGDTHASATPCSTDAVAGAVARGAMPCEALCRAGGSRGSGVQLSRPETNSLLPLGFLELVSRRRRWGVRQLRPVRGGTRRYHRKHPSLVRARR